VAGGSRKLHLEELHNLYSVMIHYSGDQFRYGHVACLHREMRNAYKIFVGSFKGRHHSGGQDADVR
jgi:hypothetical protein